MGQCPASKQLIYRGKIRILGLHGTPWNSVSGDPYGTRTRVFAVRGRRPGPLDEGAVLSKRGGPYVGLSGASQSVVAVTFAQVAHQLGERRFHLVLHLADQLVLAHSDMVERLRIAVGKGLQVRSVEHAPGDQLGEDDEQAVGVGDRPGDQRLVDHRQPFVAVGQLFFVDVAHVHDHGG